MLKQFTQDDRQLVPEDGLDALPSDAGDIAGYVLGMGQHSFIQAGVPKDKKPHQSQQGGEQQAPQYGAFPGTAPPPAPEKSTGQIEGGHQAHIAPQREVDLVVLIQQAGQAQQEDQHSQSGQGGQVGGGEPQRFWNVQGVLLCALPGEEGGKDGEGDENTPDYAVNERGKKEKTASIVQCPDLNIQDGAQAIDRQQAEEERAPENKFYRVHLPVAPQGRTRPDWVTGRPSSSETV